MTEEAEDLKIDAVDGIPLTADAPGFSSAEMTACPACSKPNPPNRPGCLYCGAELSLQSSYAENFQIRPAAVEAWERGFNVVNLASGGVDPQSLLAAVELDEALVDRALVAATKIPLTRVSKANEAEAISRRLNELGAVTAVVSDADLLDAKSPSRLRAIRFGEEKAVLYHFNSGDSVELSYADISLIVTGSIYERHSEATEKKRGKSTGPENESMTVADYGVIDLYTETAAFRISTNGFDFSCLGDAKSLVAVQNLERLAAKFEAVFTLARIDREYRSLTKLIGLVWPPASSNASNGFQRVGFRSQWSRGEVVTNGEQFTKYSRLQAMFK